jgi:hypothetical protein
MKKPTLNLGCGPDDWGDIRVDVDFRTQTGVVSKLNVMADAQFLPFVDQAFSHVRCWHVLEHLPYPRLAIKEIIRVGTSGSIRFPVDDGFKRELLRNFLAMSSPKLWKTAIGGMKLAAQTRKRRLHLWVIKPVCTSARTNSFDLFPFLLTGRKSKFFKRVPLPRIAHEWEVTF